MLCSSATQIGYLKQQREKKDVEREGKIVPVFTDEWSRLS
jgi:hypothetical protein